MINQTNGGNMTGLEVARLTRSLLCAVEEGSLYMSELSQMSNWLHNAALGVQAAAEPNRSSERHHDRMAGSIEALANQLDRVEELLREDQEG